MKNICRKITEYPLIAIFFAICAIMLALYLLCPQKDFSDMENRYLTKRPDMTASGLLDGSFMDTFETYTNEQIPMRNMFVRCKAVFVWLTGASENDGIAKGDDSYLFDKVPAVTDRMHKNIAAIANFAKTADRDVYVAIAPTSTWVNSQRLPAGMPVLDESSCAKEMELALKDTDNAHFINLYDALIAHSDEQLYYRTDHHWTTKGAGYAYSAIAESIGIKPQDISKYPMHVAYDFRGTHYAKYKGIFVVPDEIEYYDVPVKELELEKQRAHNLIDEEKFSGYDKYAAFMYGNDGKCTVYTDGNEGRELIIFKDSYANCLIPYLTMNYDKITVIDLRYFGKKVSDVLGSSPDADVLLLYNWTFLNEDNHIYKITG